MEEAMTTLHTCVCDRELRFHGFDDLWAILLPLAADGMRLRAQAGFRIAVRN